MATIQERIQCTRMAKKREVYWTPERIEQLIDASGVASQRDFAKLVRISPQLLSSWLTGYRKPQPLAEMALDCLAVRFGIPSSES